MQQVGADRIVITMRLYGSMRHDPNEPVIGPLGGGAPHGSAAGSSGLERPGYRAMSGSRSRRLAYLMRDHG